MLEKNSHEDKPFQKYFIVSMVVLRQETLSAMYIL